MSRATRCAVTGVCVGGMLLSSATPATAVPRENYGQCQAMGARSVEPGPLLGASRSGNRATDPSVNNPRTLVAPTSILLVAEAALPSLRNAVSGVPATSFGRGRRTPTPRSATRVMRRRPQDACPPKGVASRRSATKCPRDRLPAIRGWPLIDGRVETSGRSERSLTCFDHAL